jgi:hypothetical protein
VIDVQRIIGCFGSWLLWCTLALMLALSSGAAFAQGAGRDPCSNTHITPISNCQNQVQSPITYNGLETKTWAYHCGGDHPYFYYINGSWSIDNSNVSGGSFSGIENPVAEHNNLDATFTNWSVFQNDLIVTLACSDSCCDSCVNEQCPLR